MDEHEEEPGYFDTVTSAVASYGWHLLILTLILAYLYSKAKPHIDRYLQYRSDQEYAAKYHKDPDLLISRVTAQQQYVSNLQSMYNKDAEDYKRKMEQKEAKKKEEWLVRNEGNSTGNKLGNSPGTSNDGSKSLKPEYNPLMGSSTRNYRPPKKSGCGGGGCGK